MKGFTRDNLVLSLCGLPCALCTMRLGNHCPGCGGGPGNQSCHIAKCSLGHGGVEFCFECSEYPCKIYQDIEHYDSFISHQCQVRRLNDARDRGSAIVTEELVRRRKILDNLLANHNDGRHKSYYCIATSLLPLEELKNALEELEQLPSFQDGTIKERISMISDSFNKLANQYRIELKLRKQPTALVSKSQHTHGQDSPDPS